MKSRTFYNENGQPFCRQDYDRPHYDKKKKIQFDEHEHNMFYNENGLFIGEDVDYIPFGYTSKSTY